MFSVKKGFVLLEGILAVLITGVIVMVIASVITLHENTSDSLHRKAEEMQEKYTHTIQGIEVCQNCTETADPSS